MIEWTSEKLADHSPEQIKALRENALKRGNAEIVALCDAELARRSPPKKLVKKASRRGSDRGPVLGYHLKCKREQGVIQNPDGTFWTGTWAIAESQAERSLQAGSYAALHEAKADPSYLQGNIKAWRPNKRQKEYAPGRKVQKDTGVDFLVVPTDKPLMWIGDGSGERGYAYVEDLKPDQASGGSD